MIARNLCLTRESLDRVLSKVRKPGRTVQLTAAQRQHLLNCDSDSRLLHVLESQLFHFLVIEKESESVSVIETWTSVGILIEIATLNGTWTLNAWVTWSAICCVVVI